MNPFGWYNHTLKTVHFLEKEAYAAALSGDGITALYRHPVDYPTIVPILAEVERARRKHPVWPATDHIHVAAIVCEESGELMKATLEFKEGKLGATIDNIHEEAVQTAATAIRLLEGK